MHLRNLVAEKSFYKKLLTLMLPIVLQSTISSVVGLVDNVMVGQLTIESLSAVSITNQLMMIFNLSLFGAMAGGSIYGAQYHGQGNTEGMRYSFRLRLILALVLAAGCIGAFSAFGTPLIQRFLHQGADSSGDLALTLSEAQDYLHIILFSMVPFAMATALSSALRDTGETFTPMVASVLSILTNTLLNFVMIFGHLGFPAMGVRGAALATVIARFVEFGYLYIRSYQQREKHAFLVGAFKSFRLPLSDARAMLITGLPMLFNEGLWSVSNAMIVQCYSTRGLDAIAAINICTSVFSLFALVMGAMGTAIAILLGQQLGSGDKERAYTMAWQLIALDLLIHIVLGGVMAACSGLIPQLYEVAPAVRDTAQQLIIILACLLPMECVWQCGYYILRAGGKTLITFLFDCGFCWCVSLVLAKLLTACTGLSIVWIYGIVQGANIIKTVGSMIAVKSKIWLNTVTAK